MADEAEYNHRDYRGTEGAIDDADPPPSSERREGLQAGRSGESKVKSPRRGVRDPGKASEGSEGEPAYGAPIDDSPENRGK
jgi:hypothetical protein